MELEDLRLAAYRSFAETGRAPSTAMLAEQLETNSAEINSGLEMLAHNRHVVLNRDDDIVMAHPFSAVPLGYAVMGSTTLWSRQHCGGVAAHGTPSRCLSLCTKLSRCWSRPDARRAAPHTHGTSA